MAHHLPRVAMALALLAIAGCSRDLDLPAEAGGPTLTSITPASAYAGEVVEIAGAGFAQDPTGNLVQFASTSARGEGFSTSGGLLLHVPADAGTGKFTVATSRGTSTPAGPFGYLGLGELRTRQAAYEIPLLHKPYRVIASHGETLVDSDLVVGLLRYGRPDWVRSTEQSAVGFPASDTVVFYEDSGTPTGYRLTRVDLATDAETYTAGAIASGQPVHLVAMPSTNRVAVVRRSTDTAQSSVTLHDATTLALVGGNNLPTVAVPHGCDDATGNRLACVYHDGLAGEPGKLALVNGATVTTLVPATGALHHNDFDLEEDDPICVAIGAAGHHVAVVGRADGRLLVSDLDTGGALGEASISTGSATPAQSLTCAGGSTVLVAKTADDLLVSVDVVTGAINWAASVPRAARMAVEDGIVHVAGDADDLVELRSLSDGKLLSRRSFDALPGRDDGFGVQGVMWTDTGAWFTNLQDVYGVDQPVPALLLVTYFPYGLLEVPLEAKSSLVSFYPLYLDVPDAIGIVPGIQGGYLALREKGLGKFDLTSFVQLGQDGPTDYYAGTGDGLVTIVSGGATHLTALPGALFRSMGLHPAGGVWAAVNQPAAASVLRWTELAAKAGAPTATWSAPGALDGAAVLGGTLWAFYWDGDQDHAVELDDGLTQVQDIPLGDYLNQILAVSPNGRTFVSWESQPFSENTSVVIWSADPDAGMPRVATVPVIGQVTGAAFDPSGEKLYVTMQRPGRILVIE
ncbi:MAG: IPT/TIG domain-containing protein [Anaeromyxobacteraceae bacterium]